MKTNYLVLGATGGIGFAVVTALLEYEIPTTILVRNYEEASKLFGSNDNLKIAIGDANDSVLLKKIGNEKTHIFHGLNVSYEKWNEAMPILTRKVIDAASHNGAIVVFPGNNYNYGLVKEPITEITPFHPTSELGKIRIKLEHQLQEACQLGRINALVVRLSELWGPNVKNKSFEPVFTNAIKGKAIPWLYTVDTSQQMAYNMDAGRAIVELSLDESNGTNYSVFNYAGELHVSMKDFFRKLSVLTNQPLKIKVAGKGLINMLGYINPTLRSLKTIAYKYKNTIQLDDSKFKKGKPSFKHTPLKKALTETVNWFDEHSVKPNRQLAKMKLKRNLVDFVADNLSIGLFPLIIDALVWAFPDIQAFAVIIGVVAGIYWSPATRNLLRKLFSINKAMVVGGLLTTMGLNVVQAQTDQIP